MDLSTFYPASQYLWIKKYQATSCMQINNPNTNRDANPNPQWKSELRRSPWGANRYSFN